ncbi:hypothetical protein C8Q78DRAFT_481169 [Trametes maxima]|nr:hypothetical protein C8Q78DRAFT_481169 [Trametes maxima]
MTPTLKDSDAIDKTALRRPIVLRTLPSLSFSTPTHSVSIQLSFGSGALSTLKPLDMTTIRAPLNAVGNHSTRSSVERYTPIDEVVMRVDDIETRLDSLEARVSELSSRVSTGFSDLREEIRDGLGAIRAEMKAKFDDLDWKLKIGEVADSNTWLEFVKLRESTNKNLAIMSNKIDALEKKTGDAFRQMSTKISMLEKKVDVRSEQTNNKISALEKKVDERFVALETRMDGMDEKLDNVQTTLNLILMHLAGSPQAQRLDTNQLIVPVSPRSPTSPTSPYSTTSAPRSPVWSTSGLTVPYAHGAASASSPALRNRSSTRSLRNTFTRIRNLVSRNASTMGAEIDAIEREAVDLAADFEDIPPVPPIPAEHQSEAAAAAADPSERKIKLMIDQPIVPNIRLDDEEEDAPQ